MTQAYNLAILANAVDTSGKLNVGTNATGTLPVANGGTGLSSTPSNGQLDIGNGSGFTRATLTAGSGISITNGAGSITIASSGGSGTVTSVATGNGLQGGTITTSGTLSVACPTFNTVGSYCTGWYTGTNDGGSSSVSQGSNYSVGTSNGTINVSSTFSIEANGGGLTTNPARGSGLSGTWKWMTGSATTGGISGWGCGLICRVS